MSTESGETPGSGTNLPPLVLLLATISAGFATVLSLWTIWLQLKNYRKITLQRFVVRILIMYVDVLSGGLCLCWERSSRGNGELQDDVLVGGPGRLMQELKRVT